MELTYHEREVVGVATVSVADARMRERGNFDSSPEVYSLTDVEWVVCVTSRLVVP